MTILVTGASGFIGRSLCARFASDRIDFLGTTRRDLDCSGYRCASVGNIDGATNWTSVLDGVEVIVHLAARVHIMSDDAEFPRNEYTRVNVDGTRRLAECASKAGVKRIIFLSTVKVLGEKTETRPFHYSDEPAPVDPYAESKLGAERSLRQIEKQTGLEVVVIRPPLVYGPGVGGNIARMIEYIRSGLWLPLGRIENKRSLLAVANLCDVVSICLDHPDAAGKTFLISDGSDISTTDLIKAIAQEMGKPSRLIPVPERVLKVCGRIVGRTADVRRLCDSLQVDISYTKELLGWSPRFTIEDELRHVVRQHLT